MKNKNYYEILHVQPDAPVEVIRSSYRAMMQQLKMHPDLGGGDGTAALVNQAYAVLKNPKARAEYDASMQAQPKSSARTPHSQAQSSSNTDQPNNATATDILSHCAYCQTPHNLGKEIQVETTCAKCNSVLFPATKHSLAKSGKRIIDRIDRNWPVSYCINWPNMKSYNGITKDVSLNGMQMITNQALEYGQVLKLSSNTLEALAVVVNRRENPNDAQQAWRIGLEFLTLRFHRAQGTFIKVTV